MRTERRVRTIVAVLMLAAQVSLVVAPTHAQPAAAIRDYPVPGGWFYSQESRAPETAPPFRGYTVVDDAEAAFWTEFRRYGGVEVLGYPVSRRYRYPDQGGMLHQAFQRGVLQWRPDEGRAHLANIFEQFTEQGKDEALEVAGIPQPRPSTQLPFLEDAERRMNWITEPRFLARYFLDPLSGDPFGAQEAAWAHFGLPQGFAERPVYLREKANGKYGAPLYLPYVAQRFQKAALQLFLDDIQLDPTIVPGDGKRDCVAITASGRLARRLGAGRIIPGLATLPEPTADPPRVEFTAFVPPITQANQRVIQFELIGTGFEPGEPITVRLTPEEAASPTGVVQALPMVVSRVDAADPDGSFDQIITARIAAYTVEIRGERSRRTLDPTLDPILDLTVPTADVAATTKSRYC